MFITIKVNWQVIERLIDIYYYRSNRLERQNRMIQAAYWLGKRQALEMTLLDMGR